MIDVEENPLAFFDLLAELEPSVCGKNWKDIMIDGHLLARVWLRSERLGIESENDFSAYPLKTFPFAFSVDMARISPEGWPVVSPRAAAKAIILRMNSEARYYSEFLSDKDYREIVSQYIASGGNKDNLKKY